LIPVGAAGGAQTPVDDFGLLDDLLSRRRQRRHSILSFPGSHRPSPHRLPSRGRLPSGEAPTPGCGFPLARCLNQRRWCRAKMLRRGGHGRIRRRWRRTDRPSCRRRGVGSDRGSHLERVARDHVRRCAHGGVPL